jgi:hypothetical protein
LIPTTPSFNIHHPSIEASLNLSKIQDDVSNTKDGYSFLSHESNKYLLSNISIDACLAYKKIFMANIVHGQTYYDYKSMKQWCQRCDKFMEIMLVLFHFTSGQPGRASEMVSLSIFI